MTQLQKSRDIKRALPKILKKWFLYNFDMAQAYGKGIFTANVEMVRASLRELKTLEARLRPYPFV